MMVVIGSMAFLVCSVLLSTVQSHTCNITSKFLQIVEVDVLQFVSISSYVYNLQTPMYQIEGKHKETSRLYLMLVDTPEQKKE